MTLERAGPKTPARSIRKLLRKEDMMGADLSRVSAVYRHAGGVRRKWRENQPASPYARCVG